jgi:predicted nuclease of predicted toxin-antitoxin system
MRFLLDENLEHEVYHRLRDDGHDVRHVDLSDRFEKGDSDSDLASFSLEREFVIVTYDDDFRDDFGEDDYHAVLYLPDQTLSAEKIATVLHEISTYYRRSELRGFTTLGRSWL